MPPASPLSPADTDVGKYLEQDGTTFVVTDSFQGSTGALLLLTEVDGNGNPQNGTRVVPASTAQAQYDVGEVEHQQPDQPADQNDRIAALEAQIAALRDPAPGSGSQAQVPGGRQTQDVPQASAVPDNQTGADEPTAGQSGADEGIAERSPWSGQSQARGEE